ncbi:MAG: P27 family phage terminase small subunit [Candidatus Nealsonbacteria bacterium]|nr:P27 family phage terminase small subunit [Candidatus Nealsonbacteria bacterium]
MKPKRAPAPPVKWSKTAKRFWLDVHKQFVLEEPQHVELLRAACQQLDRADAARAVVDKGGVVLLDRFKQVKPNPAVDMERQAHLAFLRLARELGLDVELPGETRGHRRAGTGG